MSLAKTSNFTDYEYTYMVNKPENDFESHGVYSGSSIIHKGRIINFYTGNKRDKD
ncbi:sucrose-6-phosphate hydrolase [Chlamydia trachomatis]|nr:sucrose-6-phosphate hydrolase [Chlamydia trachomatis]